MTRPPTGFELREHTADVILYVWGDTLEALFKSAVAGFYAVIGDLQPAGQASPHEITLSGGDEADLLGDLLSELLYVFETAHARIIEVRFPELGGPRLRVTGRLQPVDMQRSRFDCEVKAVTRHNLDISVTEAGFETTIVLDL